MNGKIRFNLNFLASVFAAPIIIGALFKILHLPGAKWMLIIGMGCEAFIFLAFAFQKQYDDPDWSRVYPELLDRHDGPKNIPQRATQSNQTEGVLDKMLASADIDPAVIANLGKSFEKFNSQVASISKVVDASEATEQFNTQITIATSAVAELGQAYQKASASLVNISGSHTDATAYQEQVAAMVSNLSKLNAVYENELQESSRHASSMGKLYANLNETVRDLTESASDTKQVKEEMNKLAGNLTSLNTVYGNMLSAMSPIPKG